MRQVKTPIIKSKIPRELRLISNLLNSICSNKSIKAPIVFLLLVMSGCQSIPKPDLARLYANVAQRPSNHPVIFIHGAFGSELRDRDTQQNLWPGGAQSLLFSDFEYIGLQFDFEKLTPLRSHLEAYKIAETVVGTDFYGKLIRTLTEKGNYIFTQTGTPIHDRKRRFYEFIYDWRQDNVESAAHLDDFITQIKKDYQDPHLKVDIIAHSMGGLITRYYLRYGKKDVLNGNDFIVTNAGADSVDKVILVGTPNLGSIKALQNIIHGLPLGFGNIPTEVLVSMPSAFQLLPHPLNNWLVTSSGKEIFVDLFDINTWRKYQWSIFNPKARKRIRAQFHHPELADRYIDRLEQYFEKYLERGRRFVWSLTVTPPAAPADYIVFGGNCKNTPARILLETYEGVSRIRLEPKEIKHPLAHINYKQLMLEPGDGTVTKASLEAKTLLDPTVPRTPYNYFPMDYSIMFCERHSQLTGNLSFQNNLLNILLSAD